MSLTPRQKSVTTGHPQSQDHIMLQSTEDLASKIFCILVPLTPTLTSTSRAGQLIEWQTSTSWNTSEISSLLFCLGSQIGSYFGSVLTTIDIDKDSYTDLLLVGAPMYMGTEKEEQGKVYVYAVNQVRASEFGESRKIHSLQIPLIQLEYFSLAWGKFARLIQFHSFKRNIQNPSKLLSDFNYVFLENMKCVFCLFLLLLLGFVSFIFFFLNRSIQYFLKGKYKCHSPGK